MDTPDLDWYRQRLQGRYGIAMREWMIYTRVPALVEYIERLEARLNDRESLHEVPTDKGLQ